MSYKDNNPYSNFKGRDYNYPKLSSTNNFSIDQFFKIISSGDVDALKFFCLTITIITIISDSD